MITRAVSLYQSSIGKKAVMAVTGMISIGFVVGHMAGNLQAFQGPEKLNAYAVFLREMGGLLWLVRGILMAAVILHIVAAYQLTRMSWAGRPSRYRHWIPAGSDYASRTMRWSGPLLGLFIVYHLLDFTFGQANPNFIEGDVYHNFVASFSVWYISLFYILAMLALGLHMYHGIWSMFQSLGWNNHRMNMLWKKLAIALTVIVVVGNISMPVAVLLGIIR